MRWTTEKYDRHEFPQKIISELSLTDFLRNQYSFATCNLMNKKIMLDKLQSSKGDKIFSVQTGHCLHRCVRGSGG